MPLSIIIDAPVEEVYNVLNTPELNSVWNPVTETVTPISGKPNECDVSSFMGEFKTKKVVDPNKSVTITIETPGIVLKKLRYDLKKISNIQTQVDGTVELASPAHYTTVHRVVGKKLIQNLKRFIEYRRIDGNKDVNFPKEI